MRDPVAEFREYNREFARRDPDLMRRKIERMAESPFTFFRGTFHLFARDVTEGVGAAVALMGTAGAEITLVGDMHSENVGTFKAEDGDTHYDVNDFDETTTGRFDFDLCRLATSHVLASRERGDDLAETVSLTLAGVRAYGDTLRGLLRKGKTTAVDFRSGVPSGVAPVDALLRTMAAKKRAAFVGRITQLKKGRRTLIRSAKYYNLAESEKEQAVRLLADYRKRQKKLPKAKSFYEVEDVCGRVSGIGSMGRHRYVVLLAGKGSAEAGNVLLEFKESRPSAYDVARGRETDEGAMVRRAAKVAAAQKASIAAKNRYLGYAVDGAMSFQVRQLGPHDDRIEAKTLPAGGLADVARAQAMILARVHARAVHAATGPANPLGEIADADGFAARVLAFALGYAEAARADHAAFLGARAGLDRVEGWMAE